MRKNTMRIIKVIAVVAVYVCILFSMKGSMPVDFLNMSRTNQSLMTLICVYIVLTVSLNLIVGFLGELSLGHAGFYAIGAYSGCLLATYLSSNTSIPLGIIYILSLLTGGIAAAIGGLLISSSILRLRGDYLAIVTLAFGEVIRAVAKIIPGLGGTAGLMGIPSFSKTVSFTWGFCIVVITLLVIKNIINSRHGRSITAIRDNSIAAESIGINVRLYKIKVFAIAAFFAGVAGVMFGFYKTSVEPGNFTYNLSIEVLIMVVLGRIGSLRGSVIAAIILTGLQPWLTKIGRGVAVLEFIADQRMLIYSIVLIIIMLFTSAPALIAFRQRVSGSIKSFFGKIVPARKKEVHE